MDALAVELDGRAYELLPPEIGSRAVYGLWDTLVALGPAERSLGTCRAHDGDFYPENVDDYVEALRRLHAKPGQPPFPIRVDIDITQTCNAACSFCFSRPYQTGDYHGASISQRDMEAILAACGRRGTRTIRFCGGGDPLAHPRIGSILPLVHDHGMKLCVITNGDMLDERLTKCIGDHVDQLRWSVNAASDRTRMRLHAPRANTAPLSRCRERISSMVATASERAPGSRLVIWATFLLVPENVDEIVTAARQLRDVGVDSVSFRPVYHGLHSPWTPELASRRDAALLEAEALSDSPRFCVFIPSRPLQESASLDPGAYFSRCRSHLLRAVVEAIQGGARIQSCGQYRGNAEVGRDMSCGSMEFEGAWHAFLLTPTPRRAPSDCSRCIDVSVNRTLEFIDGVLRIEPRVQFYRASERRGGASPGTRARFPRDAARR